MKESNNEFITSLIKGDIETAESHLNASIKMMVKIFLLNLNKIKKILSAKIF